MGDHADDLEHEEIRRFTAYNAPIPRRSRMKIYTGVGSRKTPSEILNLMTRIAYAMAAMGWVLRSGGADGADRAFEKGAGRLKEIYYADDCNADAMEIASQYHPRWDLCSLFAKKLHGRNVFQVLGKDFMTPSRFLMCWTPDGCLTHADRTIKTGGTGTAISIAHAHGIEIRNLAVPEHRERAEEWLRSR